MLDTQNACMRQGTGGMRQGIGVVRQDIGGRATNYSWRHLLADPLVASCLLQIPRIPLHPLTSAAEPLTYELVASCLLQISSHALLFPRIRCTSHCMPSYPLIWAVHPPHAADCCHIR